MPIIELILTQLPAELEDPEYQLVLPVVIVPTSVDFDPIQAVDPDRLVEYESILDEPTIDTSIIVEEPIYSEAE
jgi:hypothetical protein